jgi:hypothetical protein
MANRLRRTGTPKKKGGQGEDGRASPEAQSEDHCGGAGRRFWKPKAEKESLPGSLFQSKVGDSFRLSFVISSSASRCLRLLHSVSLCLWAPTQLKPVRLPPTASMPTVTVEIGPED